MAISLKTLCIWCVFGCLVLTFCCNQLLGVYPDMGGGGLYTRHNAVASYLSLTGLEGIVSSQRFILCAKRLGQSWKMKVSGQDDYDMILMVVDPYSILTASSAKELRDVGWQIVHCTESHPLLAICHKIGTRTLLNLPN